MGIVIFAWVIGPSIILLLLVLGINNFRNQKLGRAYSQLWFCTLFIAWGIIAHTTDPDLGLYGNIGFGPMIAFTDPLRYLGNMDLPVATQVLAYIAYIFFVLSPVWYFSRVCKEAQASDK